MCGVALCPFSQHTNVPLQFNLRRPADTQRFSSCSVPIYRLSCVLVTRAMGIYDRKRNLVCIIYEPEITFQELFDVFTRAAVRVTSTCTLKVTDDFTWASFGAGPPNWSSLHPRSLPFLLPSVRWESTHPMRRNTKNNKMKNNDNNQQNEKGLNNCFCLLSLRGDVRARGLPLTVWAFLPPPLRQC